MHDVWWGSATQAMSTRRYSGHQEVPEAMVLNYRLRKKLDEGYVHHDYVLLTKDGSVIKADIKTESEARAEAQSRNPGSAGIDIALGKEPAVSRQAQKGQTQPAGPAGKPPKPEPDAAFFWEVRSPLTPNGGPDREAVKDFIDMFWDIAGTVTSVLPRYEAHYANALLSALVHAEAQSFVSVSTGGSISQDGSERSLGDLMILCALQQRTNALGGKRLLISIIDGDTVVQRKSAPGKASDTIALLEKASLDRRDKEAPGTRLAVALGLLPPPLDVSMAPVDDFFL